MDTIDRKLLNSLQAEFPITYRPFADLGNRLGVSEKETMERILALKQEHVIRQISAIFDTRALGYNSSLVAMRVAPDSVDEAAGIISEHPGVSHNYLRNHPFNIWFTLAVPPSSSLERHAEKLGELAVAESTRLLPTLRLFKIGVELDMIGDEDTTVSYPMEQQPKPTPAQLTFFDIQVVRELQEDIAVEPTPFHSMAQRLGISIDDLLGRAKAFIQAGQMRRFAAVLHHRDAGFGANGMAVWIAPEDRVEVAGRTMATFRAVSHCYQRPKYPDWPYNLFSMIHAKTTDDCEKVARAISEATGLKEYMILYSTKEYKKVRMRYFSLEFEAWERRYLTLEPT